MYLNSLINKNQKAFIQLCKLHHVVKLYAFGSSITDKFNPDTSDIDLVIQLDIKDPVERGESLLSFWNKIEELFQRKVDLLTNNSIKNPILIQTINSTKKLIYDGAGEEVLS